MTTNRPAVAARPDRRPRNGGRDGAGAPAGRRCCATAGVPGDCRCRHARARPAPAENGSQRAWIARSPGRSTPDGRGEARGRGAALGGPGLRRPGVGRRAARGRAVRRATVAVVDFGLKQNIVRQLTARGARVRVLPHTATAELALGADAAPDLSCHPDRAIRRASRPGRARSRRHRGRTAAAGHLPGPSDRRPRRRRRDAPVALRPPRRQPSGQGPGHRARADHGAEPRGRGRRRDAAGRRRLRRQPAQPRTTARSKGCVTRACRSRPCSTTPRARPGRSTRWRSSTASCPPSRAQRVIDLAAADVGADHRLAGRSIIGQAAEFDYAGTQACRALRDEGMRTMLLN